MTNILFVLVKALCNIPLNGKIVIVGDFNVDMLQSNNKTKALNDFMCNNDLHCLVNKNIQTPSSLINHVWSNITSNYKIFILDAYWIDHDMISLILNYSNANKS